MEGNKKANQNVDNIVVDDTNKDISKQDVDDIVVDDTNKDTNKQVKEFEKLDKQSEKQKKRLRRKVRIRNGVILALIIIIIILLLRGCSTGFGVNWLKSPKTEVTDFKDRDSEAADDDHVDVFVVMNATVNKDNPNLYLANSKTNAGKFYLQFELYADGSDEYFYQSDMVEAKADEDVVLPVDVYSKLSKGSHKVKVLTKAFFYDSLEQTNGGSQTITVDVQ